MALLRKAMRKIAEEGGSRSDLLSFLVRNNQSEEEESGTDVLKLVGGDNEVDFDDDKNDGDEDATDSLNISINFDDMDSDNDDEFKSDDDYNPDESNPSGDEGEAGDEDELNFDQDKTGSDELSDGNVENEPDGDKKLSMLKSLLSNK